MRQALELVHRPIVRGQVVAEGAGAVVSESFDLRDIGRFTVGAIGEPGHRVFYFQVFADGTEVAVKCEKQQAQALVQKTLNAAVVDAVQQPGASSARHASKRLGVILDSYTVYLDLWVIDTNGRVVASGRWTGC